MKEIDAQPDRELVRFMAAKVTGLKTVLFVCTGNAFRSQIAEGLVNFHLKGQWAAFSAGLLPAAIPCDLIKVMAEKGIDITGHRPKHIDIFTGCRFDKVFVLSRDVNSVCPQLPDCAEKEVLHFPDPICTSGYSEGCCISIKSVFRDLRDSIEKRLLAIMKCT